MRVSRVQPLRLLWSQLRPAALAILLSGATGLHAEPVSSVEPVTDTMHKLASDVQVLLPLIYQYDKPATLTDKMLVNNRIDSLLTHVDKLASSVAPRSATYQISYQVLLSQLQLAQLEFASGRGAMGMNLLRSATSVCATCHTQDERAATWLTPDSAALADAFIAGEFLFMTRQYDGAFNAYENWLRQQKTLEYDKRTLTAFERLLLTALQMQKSPQAITGLLGEFIQRDNINGLLKNDLSDWVDGIHELQTLTSITTHPEPDALKTMATDWLGNGESEPVGRIVIQESRRPRIVWLRGELYRALTYETDPAMIADWLYWLALSDRVLEYRFYYSLADMYLKQCMLEYSDDPIAQSCYSEYENYIVYFYSGSSGTHIPPEVKAELESLKHKVFNTGASTSTPPVG